MRVRVYDAEQDKCFQSELYAVLNSGVFERCLVVQDGILRLFDRVVAGADGHYRTHVGYIDPNCPAEWIFLRNCDLADFSDFPKRPDNGKYDAFKGYAWVWENRSILRRVLSRETVSLTEAGFPLLSSLLPGRSYVTIQPEAEHLLQQVCGFHDCVLVQLHYTSGSFVASDNSLLAANHVRQVTMLFHSQCCPPFELVFEGVKALNLRPAGGNSDPIIFEATIHIRNAAVFFCDGACEDETTYDGTKVFAYSLRWRFLDKATPAGAAFP